MAKSKEAMDTPEVRAKIRAACLGCPADPKTIAAMREAAKRPESEEWKRGQSERSRKMWENAGDYGLPSQHRWTDEEVALFGTLSDRAVAAAMRLPVHVVVHRRLSLGISTTVLQSWTDEEISVLGTDTDREVARSLGRSLESIRAKRQKLRIPALISPWTEEEIALLGTDTDREIGRRLGKHAKTVRNKREVLGIPPFVARWTEEEISRLGIDTDDAIAKALGRSQRAVATQRVLRGISAYREPGLKSGDDGRKKETDRGS